MNEAISEARRHIDNAKNLLSKNAKKQDGLYYDKKYVKIAGRTAYTGMLFALNELLGEKNRKSAKCVEWYEQELGCINKPLLTNFVFASQILHSNMGYQGSQSVELAKLGLKQAEKIISWVEIRLAKTQ